MTNILLAAITLISGLYVYHKQQYWNKKHDHYQEIMNSYGIVITNCSKLISELEEADRRQDYKNFEYGKIFTIGNEAYNINNRMIMSQVFISEEAVVIINSLNEFIISTCEQLDMHLDENATDPDDVIGFMSTAAGKILKQTKNRTDDLKVITKRDLSFKTMLPIKQ
ncbi:hypothetical protein M1D97_01445 [Kushneria sp. AK178]